MIDIHINIGSNSGDREALIEQAVAAVSSAFPDAVEIRRSDIIETEPWGFDSPHPFLNIGLLVRLDCNPYKGDRNKGKVESENEQSLVDDSAGISQKVKEEFAVEILHILQRVQTSIDPSPHRDASGAYIDRAIDIDLIAINDWVVETPELSLPHPRMLLRDFVMIPLRQLDPQWKHPLRYKTT